MRFADHFMHHNPNSSREARKQQARTLFQARKYEEARELYEALHRENRMDAESCYMLGSTYAELGTFTEAVSQFRSAIQLQPDAFIAHCALGSALNELANHTEAEQCFRNALRIKPDNPDILAALANTLILQGRHDTAEKVLHTALRLAPASANTLHTLGSIYQLRRQLNMAVDYYTRSLEINPDQPRTHNQLGYAMYTLGKIREAIHHYREALRLAPRYSEAYLNLGYSLLLTGDAEQAQSAFNQVLVIDPDNLDAIAAVAILLDNKGDFEGVYDRCLPLIKSGIKHSGIGLAYASVCRHFACCEHAVEYLEAILESGQHKITTEEQLHFALGDLYNNLGKYDDAFAHYSQGNASKPDTFRPFEYSLVNQAIIGTFNWQFLTSAPRSNHISQRPVFIVGMPRSGTTLAEQILASHPHVFGAGELTDISDLVDSLNRELGATTGFPHNMRGLTQEMIDSMASTYLAHLNILAPDSSRIIDKMPQNFIYLGLIALAFPQARVIHCVRDPRDTCLSIYFQNFNDQQNYSCNLAHIGFYYRQYHKLMQHWKSLLEIPIMDIHYEDMVNNTEELSRRLMAFCGLEWDDSVLNFYKIKRTVVTASYDQVRQPIYHSSMQRWRHYERHLEPLLKALEGL